MTINFLLHVTLSQKHHQVETIWIRFFFAFLSSLQWSYKVIDTSNILHWVWVEVALTSMTDFSKTSGEAAMRYFEKEDPQKLTNHEWREAAAPARLKLLIGEAVIVLFCMLLMSIIIFFHKITMVLAIADDIRVADNGEKSRGTTIFLMLGFCKFSGFCKGRCHELFWYVDNLEAMVPFVLPRPAFWPNWPTLLKMDQFDVCSVILLKNRKVAKIVNLFTKVKHRLKGRLCSVTILLFPEIISNEQISKFWKNKKI